ncbi:MAG: DUF4417 domain-containing protein [Lachnospiraceae bacterium]|nr:DUF4417 domain-containing protein [Lachnospiraceae bacterium]
MNVIDLKVNDLIPYEKNPRRNDKAVKFVANSIEKFGFKVPIVVDSQMTVICGHTRLKAAKKLGLETVPCVIADDLNEEQIKAFRLADNKVSEQADWDWDLLDGEINDITNLDMGDFGFVFEEAEDVAAEKPKKNERLRTDEAYNLPYVDLERTESFYQMPIIQAETHKPTGLMGFNYALTSQDHSKGIHFYVDDYQFERIWNDPHKYINILRDYDCVLTPDFSLYMDMPMSMKIWNVFRSRLIGQMMQDEGLTVIPTVSWAEPETFDFAFAGLPEGGVMSISTVGVKQDPHAFEIWKAGTTELIKRKKPYALLVYGGAVDFDFGKTKVYYFLNEVTERMKKNGKT